MNVSTFKFNKPINAPEMAAVIQALHPANEQRSLGITSPEGSERIRIGQSHLMKFTMAKERAPPDEHNQTKVSASQRLGGLVDSA